MRNWNNNVSPWENSHTALNHKFHLKSLIFPHFLFLSLFFLAVALVFLTFSSPFFWSEERNLNSPKKLKSNPKISFPQLLSLSLSLTQFLSCLSLSFPLDSRDSSRSRSISNSRNISVGDESQRGSAGRRRTAAGNARELCRRRWGRFYLDPTFIWILPWEKFMNSIVLIFSNFPMISIELCLWITLIWEPRNLL